MSKFDKIALSLFALVVVSLVSFDIGRKHPLKPPVMPSKEKVDTLYLHDTLTSFEPVFIQKRTIDSVLVPVVDSVRVHDTLFVYLDREQVIWEDSLSVVYASGILPQVDSVRHFVQSKIVTIERQIPVKVRSKWGIGIQAGYGATDGGLFPYVGVGLSYNLLSW